MWQRLPRRLVEMDVLSCGDAGLGSLQQIADSCFDQHKLEARNLEQLVLRHERKAAIRLLRLGFLTKIRIGFGNCDYFVVGRSAKDRELARMGMAGANLGDLDGRFVRLVLAVSSV